MEIDITGRHFQITDGLKQHALDKLQKLDKYSLKIESIHVVMEVQKFHHICEITLNGKNLRTTAKEESADMYSSFDTCYGNIQLQLRRQHERVKDHKARRYEVEPTAE